MPSPAAGKNASLRPGPLAHAPIDELVDSAVDVARDWLLETLKDAPLDALGTVPAAEFARCAPQLCGAVARALGSDEELDRLRMGGDLAELGAAAGSLTGAASPAGAVAAVDRLRSSLWATTAPALRRFTADDAGRLAERLAHVCSVVASATVEGERDAEAVAAPTRSSEGGIRAELAERLESAAPQALLLVELEDARRLALADPDRRPPLPAAVREAVRECDLVLDDGEGRVWVAAAGAGRPEAEALGNRIAARVRALGSWGEAPLLASVGIAVKPDDGHDAPALAEVAEEGVFSARAAGTPLGL
jgi:hypothetical protein